MALLCRSTSKKSMGPGNINPHLLKRCAAKLATPLTQLCRECLTSQTWPALWKQARVVAVHKRGSRTNPKNYRPIPLLSVVGKTLEILITRKVTAFLDADHLNYRQFGFRSDKSAIDLLLLSFTEWNIAIDSGREVFIVYLDIAGALDWLWHKGVTAKVRSLGVCGGLLHLLEDCLHGRTLHTVVNGHSIVCLRAVSSGLCSGVSDILQLVPEAQAYADECTLTFTCDRNHRQDTVDRINVVLQSSASCSRRWQITLAPERTQVLHIFRRREDTHPLAIFIEGRRLPFQQSISVLRVEVDAGLTFTTHVRKVARDPAWKLSCVRRAGKILDGWGIASLYRTQVRHVMEYTPLTWSSYLAKLERIQARAQGWYT
uniref:Reverse transcriptase domain-containing protein n=1 Tax=Scylla olivacea TaxID=85551 RepID=A0A0P4VXZ1_SCYOL